MNREVKIAKNIVLHVAKELLAGEDNFGFYSIEFDKTSRTFTVYFILNEDAVGSLAMENAKKCMNEIKRALSGNKLVNVTSLQDNQKSFSFTIVVDECEDKTASEDDDDGLQFRFAAGDDKQEEDGESGGDSGNEDSGAETDKPSDESDDSKEPNDNGEEESNDDNADAELFDMIEKTVSRICEKYNWDVQK